MSVRRFAVSLAVWCALSAGPATAGVIEKVVAFPTADTLRVQVSLRADQSLAGVLLEGEVRPAGGGEALWKGSLGSVAASAGKAAIVEHKITGLKPRLWTPGSPVLYELTVSASRGSDRLDSKTIRTGFRSVESRGGQILLNGKPIFLCGQAINPPGRGVPEATAFTREFAYTYVKYLRSQHFNCIRLNLDFVIDSRAQFWFDACDELGMMLYQGCYGSPPTGDAADPRSKDTPPKDVPAAVTAYEQVFETYARHPAIIIYVLSNELPFTGSRGQAWHTFLTAAYEQLRAWDATRLYIGNAGYGEGREGDLNDVHRYWGWYYNSFLTYYNLRNTKELFGERGAVQPFTFSECVGSFTSSLGEFNLTYRKQIGAQLEWTGHSPNQSQDALAYQAFMAKHACESFRTLREMNPRLTGLMPFTILFYNWNGITAFEQMQPKPVVDAMAAAYQPVLSTWELWTPQVYAGSEVQAWSHVVNDAEDFGDLQDAKLRFALADKAGKSVLSGERDLPGLPYFGHHKLSLKLQVPKDLATGDYTLTGSIIRGGNSISQNTAPLFVAGPAWRDQREPASESTFLLYDPSGTTAKALSRLGIKTNTVSDLAKLPPKGLLIVGEDVLQGEDFAAFVRAGGRVLVLGQDREKFNPASLPVQIEMLNPSASDPEYLHRRRPTRDGMYINIERPEHSIFAGLDRTRLRLWSDYTDWNQSKPGFPSVYPVTRGFRLLRADDLARTAILANYDRGLEAVAICEAFDGEGSVVLTGLDLVKRVGLDPVADRMLMNMVNYLAADKHEVHPLIREPIEWGRYASEKGLITGPLNGLVVNCRWVKSEAAPNAQPLPDNTGAWNELPGEQFTSIGRRPIGPFTYSSGTSVVESDKRAKSGTGFFYAALPRGRKAMVTTIQNPASEDAAIEIEVNGHKDAFTVSAGKTVSLRSELQGGATTVAVRYSGDKRLVLLTTAFE